MRIVFIASDGGGNEVSFTAESLEAAEIVFMKCGLTQERASALRKELDRDKVVSAETIIDAPLASSALVLHLIASPFSPPV